MTETEYLMAKLAEECVEVAQRCTKVLCFGEDEVQELQPLNNVERVNHEMLDVAVIVKMLRDRGVAVAPMDVVIGDRKQTAELMVRREKKVLKFMEYSLARGTLSRMTTTMPHPIVQVDADTLKELIVEAIPWVAEHMDDPVNKPGVVRKLVDRMQAAAE